MKTGSFSLALTSKAEGLGIGLAKWEAGWEIPTVNDTLLREKNQITLPTEIVEAADLTPTKDRIDWRFEAGEIRGRKLTRRLTKEQVVQAIKTSPLKFNRSWEQMRKETREP